MGDQGRDGGAAAAAAPPTVPPRGASRAVLLEQRKKEVQDAAVVGALVKVVYMLTVVSPKVRNFTIFCHFALFAIDLNEAR